MSDWLETVTSSLERAADTSLALSPAEVEELLQLASYAAKESGARLNAPLVCYLVGRAATPGALTIAELSALVRSATVPSAE